VLAALAWALLQWLGGWYVDRQLSRAGATYGAFALVIGLLSWLYLASTVTLLAAEVNVVRSRRLWPRSLAPPPLGGPTSGPWRACWPSRRNACPTSGSRSASTATPKPEGGGGGAAGERGPAQTG
jgi:membrane protein